MDASVQKEPSWTVINVFLRLSAPADTKDEPIQLDINEAVNAKNALATLVPGLANLFHATENVPLSEILITKLSMV